MTEKDIQKVLMTDILEKGNVCAPNIKYYQKYETDLLGISKSSLITEFEIKRSAKDYEADFTKGRKGRWPTNKHRDIAKGKLSNYFYFVCQPYVINLPDIPEHAGLIYITDAGIEIQKRAPKLHSKKAPVILQHRICRSLAYKFIKYM